MSYIFSEMKTFRLSVDVDDLVWRRLKIAYYVAIWFLYSQKNVAKSAYFTQKKRRRTFDLRDKRVYNGDNKMIKAVWKCCTGNFMRY